MRGQLTLLILSFESSYAENKKEQHAPEQTSLGQARQHQALPRVYENTPECLFCNHISYSEGLI